ncbi:MAG: translation elongation factor Ts [Lachnospiraceae bacterium]|nr:translation elongation factor Ts [Lachnospiraceae bacterium]
MAAITASLVKELREITGAGMMDCKKALQETDGNIEEAIEYLRINGQAKAEKKASRIAAEGLVMADVENDKSAAIVEVNSETDFVAKNAEFQQFVKCVAKQALNTSCGTVDALLGEAWNDDPSKTVQEALVEKIATIGEKIDIRRFAQIKTDGCVVSYIHGGGRIGVLVAADTDVVNDEIRTMLKNIAMQVAAMSPKYISDADVDSEYLAHEKSILFEQAKAENAELPEKKQKPEHIIEKMVDGRLKKELKEVCLMDQVYVQNTDLSVGQYVDITSKDNNANLKITEFIRFETGEGIEKKQEDFAAEVAAQLSK